MANRDAIAVAVTDDDITVAQSEILLKLQEFHDRFQIPVTYFIVPFPRGAPLSISGDPALCDALRVVQERGSEACAHSYQHNLFEWGYPEIAGAMSFSPPACEAFADARFAIERYHQKECMRERLRRAREEWHKATGCVQKGFRSGWGSFSGTLYELLSEEGFEWSSLRFASRTSWLWCMEGQNSTSLCPDSINPAVGLLPFRQNGVIEFPVLGDFGFHTYCSRRAQLVELFKRQFMACVQQGAPCVLCHHPHGLEANDTDPNSGYDIYTEIFTWLKESGLARFVTMSALYSEWKDKAQSPPEQPMPAMG